MPPINGKAIVVDPLELGNDDVMLKGNPVATAETVVPDAMQDPVTFIPAST
jgi:hypothetical protein